MKTLEKTQESIKQERDNVRNRLLELIKLECDDIKSRLLQKNKEYGDSAINPLKIFSSCDAVELIKIRIDDKLSRILNKGKKDIKEDTVFDLIGYLMLIRVAEKLR